MAEDLPSIIDYGEDISNAEAPPPLPQGHDYPATIVGAKVRLSNSNKKYVAVDFLISPDAFPIDYDANLAPEGKTVTYRRVPAESDPASKFRMRKFCETIGAPRGSSVDVNEWIGKTALVTLGNEEFEGIPRETITAVKSAQ